MCGGAASRSGWQEDRNISVKAPLLSDCSHLWMEAVGVFYQRDISVCWADLSEPDVLTFISIFTGIWEQTHIIAGLLLSPSASQLELQH